MTGRTTHNTTRMRTARLWKQLLSATASSLPFIYRRPLLYQRAFLVMAAARPSSDSSLSLSQVLHDLSPNDPNQFFLLDGGTGEELFRQGIPDDRKIWSATAVVHPEYHDVLERVHSSFLRAGAQAITTNSYGIVPGVGFEDSEERSKLLTISGAIARRAVSKHSTKAFVLGSLGPLVESYRADLIRPHAQGVEEYGVACRALGPFVDAFLAETMSCWEESRQALEAIASSEMKLPVMVSFTLDSKGNTRDGQLVTDCIRNVLEYIRQQKLELLAVLFNCCEPEAITIALARIMADTQLQDQLRQSQVQLGAYANRLTAVDPNWTLAESEAAQPFRSDLDQDHYWNDFVRIWTKELGVKLVGGCCGMTPEHIAFIHSRRQG